MSDLPYTDDPAEVARRVDALRAEAVDLHIAEGRTPRAVHEEQASLQNEVHRVYFRAGLLACRNVEALPVALNFLCATSGLSADAYEAGPPPASGVGGTDAG